MSDDTLSLLRDPYGFIGRRARLTGRDAFETRLLGRRAVCVTGPRAAELFYDEARFTRVGAAPLPLQLTLFGRGGVQGLDGPDHRHRKALFSHFMEREQVEGLVAAFTKHLEQQIQGWTTRDTVALYPEFQRVLVLAVCEWAGIPLSEAELGPRTRQLVSLFDDAGALAPRHLRSVVARRLADRWAEDLINDARAPGAPLVPDSPVALVATYRTPAGDLLPARIAGVELLNLLRPTVAVSVFLTLVGQALRDHPEWRDRLRADNSLDDAFVQEVRRFYPFFPAAITRVRRDFEWHGVHFGKGQRVLLDLYGTDHDDRTWEDPHRFDPMRFHGDPPGPFAFVPQGGGEPQTHHRCPGEPITVALMKAGTELLARRLDYGYGDPAEQLDTTRAPALPRHGLLLHRPRERTTV
ncbi:cytochrome P450 [Nocardioides sp. HB32]